MLILQGKIKNTGKDGDHQKLINYLASKLEIVFKECGFSAEQTRNPIEVIHLVCIFSREEPSEINAH